MNDTVAVLVGLALVVVLVATMMIFVIPEPSNRAIVATDRLDLAVLGFRNSTSWDGADETLRARVESRLVNAQGISVFSRSELDSLLAEQMMSETGMIDAATAVRIGSLTGVNKLVTGVVYGVEWREDETTVCLSWSDGVCTEEGPGIRYSVRVAAQVSVVNTATGLIERSFDQTASDTSTLPAGSTFGGHSTLLASAADQIAQSVTSALSASYTRELRYGLYAEYEPKRDGFVGQREATRFSASDGRIYLIVHIVRSQANEYFDVEWTHSTQDVSYRTEDVVSSGDWRLYPFDVSQAVPGRYTVRGVLQGAEAFSVPFTVTP